MIDIKSIVDRLCKKYDSRNPFEIARLSGITVVFEPLGSIRGYYQHCYRNKIIHINSDLSEEEQYITCGHELGHTQLHPNLNTTFLRDNTFFSVDKFEREANCFALQICYTDEQMLEYVPLPYYQISEILGFPEDLIRYRYENMDQQPEYYTN